MIDTIVLEWIVRQKLGLSSLANRYIAAFTIKSELIIIVSLQ